MIKDSYNSIKSHSSATFKDKGSKFISYLYPAKSEEEIQSILNQLKSEHPKARHFCYAYRLGVDGDIYRINDDGEPSSSAGRPIFNELLSAELTNVLAVVVRYFGGTKLGIPGLINAYKHSTRDAININQILESYETFKIEMQYPLDKMGIVYDILKRNDIDDIESNFNNNPSLSFTLRKSKCDITLDLILANYENIDVEAIDRNKNYDLTFTIRDNG